MVQRLAAASSVRQLLAVAARIIPITVQVGLQGTAA